MLPERPPDEGVVEPGSELRIQAVHPSQGKEEGLIMLTNTGATQGREEWGGEGGVWRGERGMEGREECGGHGGGVWRGGRSGEEREEEYGGEGGVGRGERSMEGREECGTLK